MGGDSVWIADDCRMGRQSGGAYRRVVFWGVVFVVFVFVVVIVFVVFVVGEMGEGKEEKCG